MPAEKVSGQNFYRLRCMQLLADLIDRHRGLLCRLTVGWTTFGILLYIVTPLFTPVLLVLATVAPVVWHLFCEGLPPLKPSRLTIILALAAGYLTLNSNWSLSPSDAYSAVYMLIVSLVALHFISEGLRGCDAGALRAMTIGLYAGVAIGGAFLLIDIVSHQWIQRQLFSAIPQLRPTPKHMIVQGNSVVFLEPYLLNRSITAITFLFWPALSVIALMARTRRVHLWMLAGAAVVVFAIFASSHATSKIAFLGATATFAGYQIWPLLTRRAITWTWIAVFALVAPLAFLAYQSKVYLLPWLPPSAQHRVVIWGYTSQQIAKAPMLGAGIATSRALNDIEGSDAPLAPGSNFQLTTEWHTHNIYLQTWYEAGAVGAAFLFSIGLLVLRWLAYAPRQAQPYLHATFVACALMGGSSFSLWQPWFMASFGFVAGLSMLGCALATVAPTRENSEIVSVFRTGTCR